MLDSLLGGLIIVMATSSLFYSLEIVQNALNNAGRYDLSKSEKALLSDFYSGNHQAVDEFEIYIKGVWCQWDSEEDCK